MRLIKLRLVKIGLLRQLELINKRIMIFDSIRVAHCIVGSSRSRISVKVANGKLLIFSPVQNRLPTLELRQAREDRPIHLNENDQREKYEQRSTKIPAECARPKMFCSRFVFCAQFYNLSIQHGNNSLSCGTV